MLHNLSNPTNPRRQLSHQTKRRLRMAALLRPNKLPPNILPRMGNSTVPLFAHPSIPQPLRPILRIANVLRHTRPQARRPRRRRLQHLAICRPQRTVPRKRTPQSKHRLHPSISLNSLAQSSANIPLPRNNRRRTPPLCPAPSLTSRPTRRDQHILLQQRILWPSRHSQARRREGESR